MKKAGGLRRRNKKIVIDKLFYIPPYVQKKIHILSKEMTNTM